MSTVRQHLGLLWLMRNRLATSNPQYEHAWAGQAAQFVGVHLDELIGLACGADVEDWVRERYPEIPEEFPAARATPSPAPIQQTQQEDKATVGWITEKILSYTRPETPRDHEAAQRCARVIRTAFDRAPTVKASQ